MLSRLVNIRNSYLGFSDFKKAVNIYRIRPALVQKHFSRHHSPGYVHSPVAITLLIHPNTGCIVFTFLRRIAFLSATACQKHNHGNCNNGKPKGRYDSIIDFHCS